MDLIQTWYDDSSCCSCTLHFDTGLTDLDLDSRSQECEKAKTAVPTISQSFQSVWTSYSFYLIHSVFKGQNPTYVILLGTPPPPKKKKKHKKKRFNIGLYLDIYSAMIGTAKLDILISVWMILTFIQGHSCVRNQRLGFPFSCKFK